MVLRDGVASNTVGHGFQVGYGVFPNGFPEGRKLCLPRAGFGEDGQGH